jgi:5-methyltetrahydrofolate--homocysteine methyltransferase
VNKRLVFADAQEMLAVILKEKKLTAKGIYGIFPANQVNDDDIELTDENEKPDFLDVAPTISKN